MSKPRHVKKTVTFFKEEPFPVADIQIQTLSRTPGVVTISITNKAGETALIDLKKKEALGWLVGALDMVVKMPD